jgi:hypothetical protein
MRNEGSPSMRVVEENWPIRRTSLFTHKEREPKENLLTMEI